MNNKSIRQKRRERIVKKPSTQFSLHLPKVLVHVWKSIVTISFVLGLFVTFLTLSPSVTVAPTQTLDLNDPLATPFIITNESLLPIHSVEILCRIKKIYSSTMNSGVEDLSLGYAKPPIAILNQKEQNTFLCPPTFKFKTPIDIGDITVDISYRPDFLFWRQNHSSRFVTGKDSTGVVHWYPPKVPESN
jgi:hypothetical protein